MDKFTQVVKDFWNDEEGLTAVEYAVAGGLIVVALITVFGEIGTNAATVLGKIRDALVPPAAP